MCVYLDRVLRRPKSRRNKDIRLDKPGKPLPNERRWQPMSGKVSAGRNRRSNRSQPGRLRTDTIPSSPGRRRDTAIYQSSSVASIFELSVLLKNLIFLILTLLLVPSEKWMTRLLGRSSVQNPAQHQIVSH